MSTDRFHMQSLKTRVTLLTLLVFTVCIVSLSFYSKKLLRDELLQYTGDQQRSALNLLVAEVNYGLQYRLGNLKSVASQVGLALVEEPAALQGFLVDQSYLAGLFNDAVMVWNLQGKLQASVHFLPGEVTTPGLTTQELALVLKSGQPVIGRIQAHSTLKTPVFTMAVPILDANGKAIGALAGVIRLDQPNFLSQLADHRYGKTGNFFIIDATQRLIFATSDPQRLMEVLPPEGVSPWIDRFVNGFGGTARVVNPHGVEVLVTVKQIPLANWYASVTLTPEETFALIKSIEPRARLAAVLLGLLGFGAIWWLLRLQLAPMTAALNTLDGFVRKNLPPQALPVVRQDEVGQLVGGFNRLLDTLMQHQKVLQDSEALKLAVLNSVTTKIVVLDHEGVILATNNAWQAAADSDEARQGAVGLCDDLAVGANFLAACQQVSIKDEAGESLPIAKGIQAVLDGTLPRFYLEYPSQPHPDPRWVSMSVTPLGSQALRGAVVSMEDITERVLMAQQVRQLAFHDALTQLPNRRLALERLTQQLARAQRDKTRVALLFIDLDKFKPINDELGHEIGDWLLKAVAQRILGCLRASDTAARMGGDEFVVLLPDLQTVADALAVAEKIRIALLQEFITGEGMALCISSSIGVALYPDHGHTDKDLLRMGDEAMYRAKKSGRNAVTLWAPAENASGLNTGAENLPAAQESYVHLRWKPAFESGDPLIDAAHLKLFQLANTMLDQLPLRGLQPRAFQAAFHKLLTHATEHFAQEEAILLAHGYEQQADHALQHQALITQANDLFLAAQANAADPVAQGRLIKFLVNDLVAGHLLQADRQFFSVLAGST